MAIPLNDINDFDQLPEKTQVALKEYLDAVLLLARNGSNVEFNNKDQFHAAIVMSTIFTVAKESIKIFCESFSREISDNVIYRKSLQQAIDRNIPIEVVFEKSPNLNSQCFKLLAQEKTNGKSIVLKVLDGNYRKNMNAKGPDFLRHFTLGDRKMFRYETEPKTFKAVCNFDDEDNVSILSDNFTYLKANSSDVNTLDLS